MTFKLKEFLRCLEDSAADDSYVQGFKDGVEKTVRLAEHWYYTYEKEDSNPRMPKPSVEEVELLLEYLKECTNK